MESRLNSDILFRSRENPPECVRCARYLNRSNPNEICQNLHRSRRASAFAKATTGQVFPQSSNKGFKSELYPWRWLANLSRAGVTKPWILQKLICRVSSVRTFRPIEWQIAQNGRTKKEFAHCALVESKWPTLGAPLQQSRRIMAQSIATKPLPCKSNSTPCALQSSSPAIFQTMTSSSSIHLTNNFGCSRPALRIKP